VRRYFIAIRVFGVDGSDLSPGLVVVVLDVGALVGLAGAVEVERNGVGVLGRGLDGGFVDGGDDGRKAARPSDLHCSGDGGGGEGGGVDGRLDWRTAEVAGAVAGAEDGSRLATLQRGCVAASCGGCCGGAKPAFSLRE
jgi:hypothetical protein